jgi:hypothetical protein
MSKIVPEIKEKIKVQIADEVPSEKNDYKRFLRDIPFGEYDDMVKKENMSKNSKKFVNQGNNINEYSYKDIY